MNIEVKAEYYTNGKLRNEHVLVNGIRHGVEKSYYENGKLKAHTPFINGYPFGIFKRWDRFGRIDTELMIVNGSIYNADGTRYMLTDYTKEKNGMSGVNVEFIY